MRTLKLFEFPLLLFLSISCADHLEPSPSPQNPATGQGVSLNIGITAQSSLSVQPSTRSVEEWRELASSTDLNSLLVLIYRHKERPDNSDQDCRVVGYRILIRANDDGCKYLFRNNNNYHNPNFDKPWPDVKLGEVGPLSGSELGQHHTVATAGEPGAWQVAADEWVKDVDDQDLFVASTKPAHEAHNEWKDGVMNAALLSYCHEHPLHGSGEVLLPGEYAAVCIGNFTDNQDLLAIPWPDEKPDQPVGVPVTIPYAKDWQGNDVSVSLPVMKFPAMPIGYHVKELLAFWQRHKNDPNFDGIPFAPCYDVGACGPTGSDEAYGGKLVVSNWFVGARYLLHGRILHDDSAPIIDLTTGYDEQGFRKMGMADQIESNSYLWNKEITQTFTAFGHASLKPGVNQFAMGMDHLTSLTTIRLNNRSELPVRVTSLSLSNNYAQSASTLFQGVDTGHGYGVASGYTSAWRGQPVLTSPRAIVPFVAATDAANLTEDHAWAAPDQRGKVIFEGLTFPADAEGETMTCTIDLVMGGQHDSRYVPNSTPLTLSDIQTMLASEDWQVGERRLFLLQSLRMAEKPFVQTDGDNPPHATDTYTSVAQFGDDAPTDFLWGIQKVDATQVRLQVFTTGKYLRVENVNAGPGGDLFTDNLVQASSFTISRESGFVFATTSSSGHPAYLHNNEQGAITAYKKNESGNYFDIYSVQEQVMSSDPPLTLPHPETFPIKRLNVADGTITPMTCYGRGEHLTIDINVDYNPLTSRMEFGVTAWEEEDNAIDFK